MGSRKDITKNKYGHLFVEEFRGSRKYNNGHTYTVYLVRCDCGTEKEMAYGDIVRCSFCSSSCPLFKGENHHAYKHGLNKDKLMRRIRTVISRCHNPKDKCYYEIHLLGHYVYEEWRNNPEVLHAYILNLYPNAHELINQNYQIDRIDNKNPGYIPGNIRLVTPKINTNNRECTVRVSILGLVDIPLALAIEYLSPSKYDTVYRRIKAGWDQERAVLMPTGTSKKPANFNQSLSEAERLIYKEQLKDKISELKSILGIR